MLGADGRVWRGTFPPLQSVRLDVFNRCRQVHTCRHSLPDKVSMSLLGAGSAEGTDITAMLDELAEAQFYLQTARDIVGKYKEFCKRVSMQYYDSYTSTRAGSCCHIICLFQNVPPPLEELIPVLIQPPPIHPRQTTASLARMVSAACKQP